MGGLGNGTSGFIVPALLHIWVFYGHVPKWRRLLHWAVVFLGIATAVLVTVFAIVKLARGEDTSNVPQNRTLYERSFY